MTDGEAAPGHDEDRKTFRRLGIIALSLGFLAATDSAYEIHQSDVTRLGSIFEFVLAQAAIISGLGLLQRRRGSFEAGVMTAVLGFVHSLISVLLLGSALLNLLTILGPSHDPSAGFEYGVRLLLMLSQALFWPILLGHLYIDLQCRATEEPAAAAEGKQQFWTCVAGAVAFIAIVEFVLLDLAGLS